MIVKIEINKLSCQNIARKQSKKFNERKEECSKMNYNIKKVLVSYSNLKK